MLYVHWSPTVSEVSLLLFWEEEEELEEEERQEKRENNNTRIFWWCLGGKKGKQFGDDGGVGVGVGGGFYGHTSGQGSTEKSCCSSLPPSPLVTGWHRGRHVRLMKK